MAGFSWRSLLDEPIALDDENFGGWEKKSQKAEVFFKVRNLTTPEN